MYLPPHFEEQRPEVLRALMADFPLAALITTGPDGITANHLPLLYDPEPSPGGTLRGHLARGNRQWQNFDAETEALAIFQGPQAYVSPNWYTSKKEHGRAVPTWNYAVVHAYGRLSVFSDPGRLRGFLDQLTAAHEVQVSGPGVTPWMPADAPAAYIEGLIGAIVGIEMTITRIEGKWKMSQNQPEGNRLSVAEALDSSGNGAVADLVRRAKL